MAFRHAALIAAGLALAPGAALAAKVCVDAQGRAAPEPGTSQEALMDPAWTAQMAALYGEMSRADRGTVESALGKRDLVLATIRCSPKDMFLLHLSRLGMVETRRLDGPDHLDEVLRAWAFTPYGRPLAQALLRDLTARR